MPLREIALGLTFTDYSPCPSPLEERIMPALSASELAAFQALIVGFAFAGFLANAFNWLTSRQPSFRMLEIGGIGAIASVPLVVFSAPFIILRNTVRGRRYEKRNAAFVFVATLIACGWSMVAGRVIISVLQGF
jgi:hypothetical protein